MKLGLFFLVLGMVVAVSEKTKSLLGNVLSPLPSKIDIQTLGNVVKNSNSTKSLLEALSEADPAKVKEIIVLLEQLASTSLSEKGHLETAVSDANTALAEAESSLSDANQDLVDAESSLSQAQADFAQAELDQSEAVVTKDEKKSAVATAESHRNTAQTAKVTADKALEDQGPGYDAEHAIIIQVIGMLRELIGEKGNFNYDAECWQHEVYMGLLECSHNEPCYLFNDDAYKLGLVDAYQIAVKGNTVWTTSHKRSPEGFRILNRSPNSQTTTAFLSPGTSAGHQTNIGICPDSDSEDVFLGIGDVLVRWNSVDNTYTDIINPTCRVWGISQHTVTQDLYYGCREGGRGLYRVPVDQGSATGYQSSSIQILNSEYYCPYQIIDSANDVMYFTEERNDAVYKLELSGSFDILTKIAGGNGVGYAGDGGPAVDAILNYPTGITMNFATGDIFIYDQSDESTKRIRRISPAGVITTIAASPTGNWNPPTDSTLIGTWKNGNIDEGGQQFLTCCGSGSLAMDQSSGDIYFGNTYDATVLKIQACEDR